MMLSPGTVWQLTSGLLMQKKKKKGLVHATQRDGPRKQVFRVIIADYEQFINLLCISYTLNIFAASS
jgi:hypothetical protein